MRRGNQMPGLSKACGGFTLVEILVSTALTGVILSQASIVLVSSQRVLEATMADVELSLQSHALREKLFYAINDDGGLMDACRSELVFESKGGGDGVTFRPKRGQPNRVKLGANKRLAANSQKKGKWLECGTLVFQGTNVFVDVVTGGVIQVNMDLSLSVGTRKYTQKQVVQTQIMNESE